MSTALTLWLLAGASAQTEPEAEPRSDSEPGLVEEVDAEPGLVEEVDAEPEPLERGFLHTTLDNGMVVSILSDPQLPIVATQHWVRVGSAHEAPDQRGFAHLFEHMMFSATETRERGTYATFHTKVGGSRNAYTTRDHTTYISAVAPQHHDEVLQMEAERLKTLVFDEQEMAKDRKIVTEELRLRTENTPIARLYVQLGLALLQDHPYARSPAGTIDDIAARTVDDARQFYDSYYRPDHIHLVVVGPVSGPATLARIEELYGDLQPSGVALPEVPSLTELDYPQTIELADRIPPVKATALAFPLPSMTDDDQLAVRVMLAMLVGSEIDQFQEALVTRRHKALEAGTYRERFRGGGVIVFGSASLPTRRKARAFALVEQTLDELDELAWNTPDAVDAARRSALRGEHFGVFSAERMAQRIGFAEWMLGDVQLAFETSERLEQITTDDIARVWRTYVQDATPIRVFVRRGKPEAR